MATSYSLFYLGSQLVISGGGQHEMISAHKFQFIASIIFCLSQIFTILLKKVCLNIFWYQPSLFQMSDVDKGWDWRKKKSLSQPPLDDSLQNTTGEYNIHWGWSPASKKESITLQQKSVNIEELKRITRSAMFILMQLTVFLIAFNHHSQIEIDIDTLCSDE